MTKADAIAATQELVAVYGKRITIASKSRLAFVDEENEAPVYDDAGAVVDASTLIVIGTVDEMAGVNIKDKPKATHDGRTYRVVEKNSVPGGVQLTLMDASSR